ncbi:hypothetical protein A2U01_0082888, partial [Trifolium medium]|nr:hypothetical protein [Trifolium medium]
GGGCRSTAGPPAPARRPEAAGPKVFDDRRRSAVVRRQSATIANIG